MKVCVVELYVMYSLCLYKLCIVFSPSLSKNTHEAAPPPELVIPQSHIPPVPQLLSADHSALLGEIGWLTYQVIGWLFKQYI